MHFLASIVFLTSKIAAFLLRILVKIKRFNEFQLKYEDPYQQGGYKLMEEVTPD